LKEPETNILIIGIGNDFRSDDAIGLHCLRTLQEKHPDLGTYKMINKDLSLLTDQWKNKDVILIDAVISDQPKVGMIHLVTGLENILKFKNRLFLTHSLGLNEALELSVILKKEPGSILLIGIEIGKAHFGTGTSENVMRTTDMVTFLVLDYLANLKSSNQNIENKMFTEKY
jgi:hydrogenase maturation protease